MKNISFCLFCVLMLISCRENTINDQIDAIASETTGSASNGSGKIILNCGEQTLTVEGECGGVTTMGELVIAVKDKIVPSRVFTISFNTNEFPENGAVFEVKKSDYTSDNKKSKREVYIGFSEISQNNQMDWSSDDQSGKIKFEVNANEIKCKFTDLELKPSEVYNKGELNQPAVVSGEFNLYKN